jgi:hypothetical protein
MLRDITNIALKIEMLSATLHVICHCTATAPVLSATLVLGQNPALKKKIHASNKRKFV